MGKLTTDKTSGDRKSLSKSNSAMVHGADELPSVIVRGYNLELRDEDGFIGDRARRDAFFDILDDLRKTLRKVDADPLDGPSGDIGRKKLDGLLSEGDAGQAAVIHAAIEDYAGRLAWVAKRFLRTKSWSDVRRVAVGGGFRQSRIGEIAIARAGLMLRAENIHVELTPIAHHADEAGLIGCIHLAPPWIFGAYDCVIGVDIGGTNIRCGVVQLNQDEAADLGKAKVWRSELWRHADEEPPRDEAVARLAEMAADLVADAHKKKKRVAPFIGVGCPGLIRDDGTIDRGAQNLPGDWESSRFNLPVRLKELIPAIGDHETMVVTHNDAVVQGLSALPDMKDVDDWAALTIGTGLGNASFRSKRAESGKSSSGKKAA